jgi:hypothetical protein
MVALENVFLSNLHKILSAMVALPHIDNVLADYSTIEGPQLWKDIAARTFPPTDLLQSDMHRWLNPS